MELGIRNGKVPVRDRQLTTYHVKLYGTVRYDRAGCGTVRYGTVRYGTGREGQGREGKVWNTIRYGTAGIC